MWYALVAQAAAQAPPPLSPDARFAVALFCNPTCGIEVIDALDDGLSSIAAKNGFPDSATKPLRVMGMAGTDFGIPDLAFVELYGVGVDRPEALGKSEEVLLAWFATPRERAGETLAVAHAAFGAAAKMSGGWVEDLDTQRLYGADAWKALDPAGPITDWFVVDAALQDPDKEGGSLRLVTRGLRRYGDFELVVDNVAPEAGGDVSIVVNALAEALRARSNVPFDIALDTPEVRGSASLRSAARREDDPEDPLLRVTFEGEITVPAAEATPSPTEPPAPALVTDGAPAASPSSPAPPTPEDAPSAAPATQGAAAGVAAGGMLAPTGPTSLEDAQRLAFDRFTHVVRPAFLSGLPSAEKVAIKAPFPTRKGGLEYMWVELTSVRGDELSGTLLNEPVDVDGLRKGDPITLRQGEMFDYVWKKSDGSREGNTTAALLR
ncbi:MAG: DUF2314 domain-containing protein [Pseudomonadota bacterium]|nr:DUF2314 domain-containing protein [Pseudomonadota bacterium]